MHYNWKYFGTENYGRSGGTEEARQAPLPLLGAPVTPSANPGCDGPASIYLSITMVIEVILKFWIGKMHWVLAHSFTIPISSRKTKVKL